MRTIKNKNGDDIPMEVVGILFEKALERGNFADLMQVLPFYDSFTVMFGKYIFWYYDNAGSTRTVSIQV
jgi:hypothetical protein